MKLSKFKFAWFVWDWSFHEVGDLVCGFCGLLYNFVWYVVTVGRSMLKYTRHSYVPDTECSTHIMNFKADVCFRVIWDWMSLTKWLLWITWNLRDTSVFRAWKQLTMPSKMYQNQGIVCLCSSLWSIYWEEELGCKFEFMNLPEIWYSIFTLSLQLCRGFTRELLTKLCASCWSRSQVEHALPSHLPWVARHNNVWWTVQFMKLHIIQFSHLCS
jgi:hypothetical protein